MQENKTLTKHISDLNKSINSFIITISTQEELIEKLNENKAKESELEAYWNDKYTKGCIVYKGRSLPFSTEICNIPVSVLITPNDQFIINDLKKWKLYYNYEKYETLIPKIYLKIKYKYYRYQYDRNVWGKNEVWEFPFELRAKGFKDGFDCDSWSHFQASYYIAAGVPSWMVRIVVGTTQLGGHSTVYIFSLKDNKWHHLNSTYGKKYGLIYKYPLHSHAKNVDKIGIKNVWFSFNDKYAWYKFEGDLPKDIKVLKK